MSVRLPPAMRCFSFPMMEKEAKIKFVPNESCFLLLENRDHLVNLVFSFDFFKISGSTPILNCPIFRGTYTGPCLIQILGIFLLPVLLTLWENFGVIRFQKVDRAWLFYFAPIGVG